MSDAEVSDAEELEAYRKLAPDPEALEKRLEKLERYSKHGTPDEVDEYMREFEELSATEVQEAYDLLVEAFGDNWLDKLGIGLWRFGLGPLQYNQQTIAEALSHLSA